MNTHLSPLRTVAAIGAAAALTLAACGGDDDDSSSSDDAPAAIDANAGDASSAGEAITIENFSFSGVTEVAVGTTVIVTNADGTQHTWSAVDGAFDSGALGSGDTFEFTFTEAGEFEYFCNFHPSMQGTIVVTG